MFIFYICKILRGVISIETVVPQPRRVSVKSLFLSSSFSQTQYEEFYRRVPKTKGDLGKNTLGSYITGVPRRRAGMPESWVPLTLVPSERWYRWCTPTGPGSCCRHPSHLKHTHTHTVSKHRALLWDICLLCGADLKKGHMLLFWVYAFL